MSAPRAYHAASQPKDLGRLSAAAVRLLAEVESWTLPRSCPRIQMMVGTAALHVQRSEADVLDAQARGRWTEHHTSGLIDCEDAALPPHSPQLCARVRERLFHIALGECLERAGRTGEACGAFGRAALASRGWVEAYHRWSHCLQAAGRCAEAPLVHEVAVSRGVWQHVSQRPNDLYVPGLRAAPFWDISDLPVARELEGAFPVILEEYRALVADAEGGRWRPISDQPLVETGDWSDFKLIENGKLHTVNCARCPRTMGVVMGRCPEIATQVRGSLIFSRLSGGTVIRPHCGPTNTRIRIHLGVDIPGGGARIRVGSEWRSWEAGRCLIFDDSFEHEVVHESAAARVVLIADAWHPDFGAEMRSRYLHGRHARRYQASLEAGELGTFDSYEVHTVAADDVFFVEEELRGLASVREAVAVLHTDEASGLQTLVAYIECDDARPSGEICDRCAASIRRYGIDALVLAVRSWPRRADGTIDRTALQRPPPSLLAKVA